jgi:cytochrome c553
MPRATTTAALLFSCLCLPQCLAGAETEISGVTIYKTKCAGCHGPQGEGTKRSKRKLEGDKSVSQLAELIRTTMPEDDPGSLSAAESNSVAAYIHDAFYSPLARERNRPARVELARLTVRQYRHALADLVGSFRGEAKWGDTRGLRGEYYSGRRLGRNAAAKRTDPEVNFNFDTAAPVPEIEEPREFSIRWSGSLLAPETGEYEFMVRTDHAARLWVNDMNSPLIDAWVKSGNDTEYKATAFLVAGHVYPLRLEYSKAKQGVDDSNKQKEKPPSAKSSVALLWKLPHRTWETIPARQLSPESASEVYVCSTHFPPDDRSYGWERGTTISKAWDEAETDAAIALAGYLAAHIDELAGTREEASDRVEKHRRFCRTFIERAFRRPLTDEQAKILIDRQFESDSDPRLSVKRVVILGLKSPRFLYREIQGGTDAWDVAARLSFGLWDSLPDRELANAAREGRLATKEQVARQAERMLRDPRAKAKIREFLLTWLKADSAGDLAKDPEKFPGFDAAAISDLRTSLELFLDDVVWSEQSDFRQLLEADYLFLNNRLARFYGAEVPEGADFSKVALDAERRAGVLTHPYLMTSFAHSSESSPIHRGVFLARGVLGQSMRPPPEAVAPLAPDLHPDLTTRERVMLQTRPATCMTCHGVINPLGFTLEHFDAVGRYRELDRGKPVDAQGSYRTRSGDTVTVNGARELARFVAGSDEAHAAFTEQMFHHLVQQPVRAYGPATLEDLRRSFAANGFSIRKLAVEIIAVSAFVGRDANAAEVTSIRP